MSQSNIDYTNMDIPSDIAPEVGIKIAQAHGFNIVTKIKHEDFCKSNLTWLLMQNPETGDFLVADMSETNMCYGGCTVIVARNHIPQVLFPLDSGIYGNQTSFDGNAKLVVCELSYHYGIFNQYKNLSDFDKCSIPWDVYPIRGMVHLPVPEFVNLNFFVQVEPKFSEDRKNKYKSYWDYWDDYLLNCFINGVLLHDTFDKHFPNSVRHYYIRWLDDFHYWDTLFDYMYVFSHDINELNYMMRIGMAYLGIENVSEYEKQFKRYVEDHIQDTQDIQDWYARKDIWLNCFDSVDFEPDLFDYYIVSLFRNEPLVLSETILDRSVEHFYRKC